jgi:septum formation protein
MKTLILGSSSVFRKAILEKLDLPFVCVSPDIDETERPHEKIADLVQRLSIEKAQAVAQNNSNALIIGSDGLASIEGEMFGKPHTHERAIEMLSFASGKTMSFHTGLCLLDSDTMETQVCVEVSKVTLRKLTCAQIETYLHKEKPYQSSGAIKAEGFGVALFEKVETNDFNALIGLPLMQLIKMLNQAGIDVLSDHNNLTKSP